ncbi:Gfo/Idh/MocA family protein [Aureibacillus halotolerans]|uniref:Putative dehydrogenase n=1 Tax=Aureibacillus halotolerans TaxID=1508390 RepID=A0A4R6U1F8_9BACI|nr:Gfo/Idh/MocA family oxidoreductase [Aureibacillus halotolerans]TDQ39112.1 putative dehydrogenase [Aureibacillus halotolerans]
MRIYFIGAGFISRTHMDSLRKLGLYESTQVRICDSNPKTLEDFIDLHPGAVGFSDAKHMLSEDPQKDDVVIVGTPPSSHFTLAMLGLKSGRHVLCEKPLVTKSADADLLFKEAQQRGLTIGCCSSRFAGLEMAKVVRDILQQGRIGAPYKFSFIHRVNRGRPGIEYQPHSKWFLDSSVSGGGILFDWGPYDIASLIELLEPERVEVHGAWLSRPITDVDPTDVVNDVETHCGAMMKFIQKNGDDVFIQYERASCTHGNTFNQVELEGTLGAITWDSFYGGEEITLSTDVEGKIHQEKEVVTAKDEFSPMDNPVRWFVSHLENGQSPAIVNEQAVFNLHCLQAIYQGARTGEIQIVERVK